MPNRKNGNLLKKFLNKKRKVGEYDIIRIDGEDTQSGWSSPQAASIGQGIKSPYIVEENGEIVLYGYDGKQRCRLRSIAHLESIMKKIKLEEEECQSIQENS